jgi:hypothetical protein
MQYEQYTRSGRAEFETRGTPGREIDSQSGFSEFCGGRRALLFCRSRRKETLINSRRLVVLVLLLVIGFLGSEGRSRARTTTRTRTNTARLRIVPTVDSFVPRSLSLTPRFSGVVAALDEVNRFNGFHSAQPSLHEKTAEAVQGFLGAFSTPLKRGVNEKNAVAT